MSMGGGKGGSSREGSTNISSTPDPEVSAFTKELREGTKPIRDEVYGQVLEALRTGGIGARLPIIQRSVEGSRAATSQALRDTTASASGTGLEQSPFLARVLAETRLAGNRSTNAIPTNIAKEFIDIAPALATGSSAQILTGLLGAGQLGNQRSIAGSQIQASRDIAKGQQQMGLYSSLFQAAGSVGAAFA
jgi:hypothetical protein